MLQSAYRLFRSLQNCFAGHRVTSKEEVGMQIVSFFRVKNQMKMLSKGLEKDGKMSLQRIVMC